MRFECRLNVRVCLLLVAGCLVAPPPGYADKLMYLTYAGPGLDNAELFVVEVTEFEGVVTAGVPVRLNGLLVEGGSVRIGVSLAGVPGDVIYLATQDDADVLELYRVSTDTPGVSTKLNPPIAQFLHRDPRGAALALRLSGPGHRERNADGCAGAHAARPATPGRADGHTDVGSRAGTGGPSHLLDRDRGAGVLL